MAVVWIPALLRDLAGGAEQVTVAGSTVRRVLAALEAAHPGLGAALVDGERDTLHPAFALAIDGSTDHLGLLQPLTDASELVFVPAVSGG